jgi:hypothetical protein
MNSIDPRQWPLCAYFLAGYLSKNDSDSENFPPDELPAGFERYERLLDSALKTLGVTKELLKSKAEFNFDSGDAGNLEGGIAILRAVEALRLGRFHNIVLITPKNSLGADLTAEKNSHKVCFEVKAITKQSKGREGFFFEDQLYEKILDQLPRARKQLDSSATELNCSLKIFICVVNWFAQSIYLGQDDYQSVVNKLERDQEQESLTGVDGVWFVTKMGQEFLFLNEKAKVIDDQSLSTTAE